MQSQRAVGDVVAGGGDGVGEGGGLWRDVWIIPGVIIRVSIGSVGRVIVLLVSSCGTTSLPGWERPPVVRSVWEWSGGVKEAFDQLAPIFLI